MMRERNKEPQGRLSTMSYRSSRRIEEVAPEAAKKSKRLVRKAYKNFGVTIFTLVILVCLFNILTLSSSVHVEPLATTKPSMLKPMATYDSAAQKILGSSIWNKTKVTVNTKSLSQKLETEYPEISSVSVKMSLLDRKASVYISPAVPAIVLTSPNGSFVVSSSGKVIAPAVPDIAALGLPTVTDQSGIVPVLGKQALPSQDVQFIAEVIAQLQTAKLSVSTMELPPASRELDVHLNGMGYFIKFNLQGGDPRQQVGTFLAVKASLDAQGKVPTQYVDARVDGRAYYK